MATNLTPKQWRLLKALEHHGDHGTIEVAMEFGEYEGGRVLPNGEPDDRHSWQVTRFVIGNLVRLLAKRGLATTADGWGITDAGRAALVEAGLACGCNHCRLNREPVMA